MMTRLGDEAFCASTGSQPALSGTPKPTAAHHRRRCRDARETRAGCNRHVLCRAASDSGNAAAKPYNGTWTVFSPQCGGDDGELEIRGTYWGEVDAVCRIRSVTGGRGVWTFKLDRCQGEGVKRTQQVTVFVSGEPSDHALSRQLAANEFLALPVAGVSGPHPPRDCQSVPHIRWLWTSRRKPVSLSRNSKSGLLASLVAVLTISASADAATKQPAYVGKWADSAAKCLAKDYDIVLTARRLVFVDASCQFRSRTDCSQLRPPLEGESIRETARQVP